MTTTPSAAGGGGKSPQAWEGGACRVPMWSGGTPSGFCGKPANGPQWPVAALYESRGRLNAPYCFGPCCPGHGGPSEGEPILFVDGTNIQGRPMWCAVMPGFINLQESASGFDADPVQAVAKLRAAIKTTGASQ